MSKLYNTLPSVILGVDGDSWWAWSLNKAVYLFGSHIDHEMDEAEDRLDKSKEANKARIKRKRAQQVRQAVLNKYLGTSIRGRFRDPAVEMRKDGRRGTRDTTRKDSDRL
jgi:hypothetical protein